jgi:hypothetical protein
MCDVGLIVVVVFVLYFLSFNELFNLVQSSEAFVFEEFELLNYFFQ